jgi:hypothetical protein
MVQTGKKIFFGKENGMVVPNYWLKISVTVPSLKMFSKKGDF